MADTTVTSVPTGAWLEVVTGAQDGYMTNNTNQFLLFREAASLPASTVTDGHILNGLDFINFSVVAGQNIYVRVPERVLSPGSVTITLVTVA